MAFMLLGIGYLHRNAAGAPNPPIIKAGGFFALLAAFLAWYNALAGIADDSNRYALSIAPSDYVARIRLTYFQLLRYPSHPLPLVRQGYARARQARRCRQQDCIDCIISFTDTEASDIRGSELIITMIPLTVLRVFDWMPSMSLLSSIYHCRLALLGQHRTEHFGKESGAVFYVSITVSPCS